MFFFFFNDTATTEIYTLSLHDALPISLPALWVEVEDHTTMPDYNVSRVTGVSGQSENRWKTQGVCTRRGLYMLGPRSEEHTSELQSRQYLVCRLLLEKKKKKKFNNDPK